MNHEQFTKSSIGSLSRRSMLAGVAAVGSIALIGDRSFASRATDRDPALIGAPIHNIASNHAKFGRAADGRPVAYRALNGVPSVIAQVDVRTQDVLKAAELAGATSVEGMAITDDGTVYATGAPNGHLYALGVEADQAVDLGRAVDTEIFLYGLATDEHGRVYGGSYPNGVLWQYDPQSGGFANFGQIASDSIYSRSLAVVDGFAYVGLGTVAAHLYRVDVETGAKSEIVLPEAHRAASEITNVDARLGRLFVRTSSANTIVYDLESERWADDLGRTLGTQGNVSPPGPGATVFYLDGEQHLVRYQVRTQEAERTDHKISWSSKGFGWVTLDEPQFRGRTLVTGDYIGRFWYYNPATEAAKQTEPDLPAQAVEVRSIALGPDQRVYATGYQSGGLSRYDPADGSLHQYQRGTVGQAEGMVAHAGKLYLGIYPGAVILEFDPEQPFDYGTNPAILGNLGAEQDRPFGWTVVGDQLAIGSIPNYGKRGGAVTLLDPATGSFTVNRNPVADHSVTCLTTAAGLVVGGTSVFPGLGLPPAEGDGKLFIWDPASQRTVWEGVPIPGELAVTDVVTAPNGHVFGVTVGKIFEFDPASRAVIRVVELANYDWDPGASVWASGELAFGPDGLLYAQVYGTLYRIDPATLSRTTLATGRIARLAVANDGAIYFTRGTDLYRLNS